MVDSKGGFLISQIKQIKGRIFDRLLVQAGISQFNGAQGRILYILWQQDDLPIVELARRTGLAKTTLTGMLDRLESQGNILRRYDEKDRRQIHICLTAQARALEQRYREVSQEMTRLCYRGFTQEEILQLEDGLERLLNNLKMEEKIYDNARDHQARRKEKDE